MKTKTLQAAFDKLTDYQTPQEIVDDLNSVFAGFSSSKEFETFPDVTRSNFTFLHGILVEFFMTCGEGNPPEIVKPLPTYLTIRGYAEKTGRNLLDIQLSRAVGQTAASMCRKRGLKIIKVDDSRYGHVNSYPIRVLDEVFNKIAA